MKARIAAHGNEDILKYELRSDWAMCIHVDMRILIPTAALHGWHLHQLDVKSAFLQTGKAERHVFVEPSLDSTDRSPAQWLLLTAAYGLPNSNAK